MQVGKRKKKMKVILRGYAIIFFCFLLAILSTKLFHSSGAGYLAVTLVYLFILVVGMWSFAAIIALIITLFKKIK